MYQARTRLSRRAVTLGVAVLTAAGMSTAVSLIGAASPAQAATPYKVLFDATHGEIAGNADWIISTSQPDPLAQNANPTSETSWTGAISAWGVALQRSGRYSLKTLPSGGRITYGDTSNAQDLKNYNTFVLPEPNVVLAAAEKTAIMNFVKNGGGLFMVSDHTGSDRNSDGWDSPAILNDLMTNNSVDSTDPFGYSIDLLNIASENPNVIGASAGSDPIIKGPFGTATGTIIRNGTTVTLKPADNSAVRGEIYRTGYSASGTTGVEVATSTFGSGRVMFIGDSSTIDDGTGQSGNTLYNGWNDPAGTDSQVMLNGTEWLSSGGGGATGVSVANPGSQTGTVGTAKSLQLSASDLGHPDHRRHLLDHGDGQGQPQRHRQRQLQLDYQLHQRLPEPGTEAEQLRFRERHRRALDSLGRCGDEFDVRGPTRRQLVCLAGRLRHQPHRHHERVVDDPGRLRRDVQLLAAHRHRRDQHHHRL